MGKRLALVLALFLAACTTTKGGNYCQVSRLFHPTQADVAAMSDQLVAQIVAANETYEKLCR